MKIIYNKYIPFTPFFAINILGIIFARKDKGMLSSHFINHERIHTLQQREMLFIPFYIWYFIEWLLLLAKHRNVMKAYHNISFEKEAYNNQHNLAYAKHRHHFAWWFYYMKSKKC